MNQVRALNGPWRDTLYEYVRYELTFTADPNDFEKVTKIVRFDRYKPIPFVKNDEAQDHIYLVGKSFDEETGEVTLALSNDFNS
ncbi:MAG: hypothetical protein WD063_03710 [Pirellulales bacterium]